ncbi:hypothetical protein [Pseudomonas sp. 34 E 7]|nr:hypothetical protein [Pseudomonas sp. 34 E 7]
MINCSNFTEEQFIYSFEIRRLHWALLEGDYRSG